MCYRLLVSQAQYLFHYRKKLSNMTNEYIFDEYKWLHAFVNDSTNTVCDLDELMLKVAEAELRKRLGIGDEH